MKSEKIKLLIIIVGLSVTLLACNLLDNFSGSETTIQVIPENNEQLPPQVGAAENEDDFGMDSQPAAQNIVAFDEETRKEVIALASQINQPPDLSQLSSDVVHCLANDFVYWDVKNPVRITIYDEYPSGEQRETHCNLRNELTNTADENIRIKTDGIYYSENINAMQNRKNLVVGDAIAPGEKLLIFRTFSYFPFDSEQGFTLSATRGFAAFYDRPECQVFIDDDDLFHQVWVPLDFFCKDFLPPTLSP